MTKDQRESCIKHLKDESTKLAEDTAERRRHLPKPRPSEPEEEVHYSQPVETVKQCDWNAWADAKIAAAIQDERRFMIAVVGEALGEALGKERQADKADLAKEVDRLWAVISEVQQTLRSLDRINSSEGKPLLNLPARVVN